MDDPIDVYYDWSPEPEPRHFGTLRAHGGRAGEIFEFSFHEDALGDPVLQRQKLDPDIAAFAGPQYPRSGHTIFGIFQDSSPDRWGETLIRRRFERDKRAGLIARSARLGAADYLLGVHDQFRSGALRYKRSPDGPFLDDRDRSAAPPLVRLRELEAACRTIEGGANEDDATVEESLRILLAPGASLGGARPKATVVDPDGNLWIAKFPSINDRHDVGAWEFVVQSLAKRCGIKVSESNVRRLASDRSTFLVRRFDRHPSGTRIHFASAMTLTAHTDGDGASNGASYLEIAEVISSQGANARADLPELWSRIVFNIMVSNSDDHLRNHGFLLSPNSGWRLSEAYDMNPFPGSSGLALNIDEHDNAMDLDLVRSVAPYFRIKDARAREIIAGAGAVIATWSDIATSVGISRSEQGEMEEAFAIGAR